MKRDPRLYPLSWDHHHGLVLARNLKLTLSEGTTMAIERAECALLEFWEKDLHSHFLAEEEVLFPVVHNLESCQIEIETALAEHQQFYEMIALINLPDKNAETPEVMSRFADLLVQHIRYEENVIFPKIEAVLSNEALEEIGKALSKCRNIERLSKKTHPDTGDLTSQ